DRQLDMAKAHDRAVVTGCVDGENGRNLDDFKTVIARRGERRGKIGEKPGPVVADGRGLAVHQMAALDDASEMLADRLMSEANAEQRRLCLGAGCDKLETDSGLVGRARAWRDENRVRTARHCFGSAQRVIALDPNFSAELDQI